MLVISILFLISLAQASQDTPPAPTKFFVNGTSTGRVLQWEPVQFEEQFSYELELYQGSKRDRYFIIPSGQTLFPVYDTAITRAILKTKQNDKSSTAIELDMTQSDDLPQRFTLKLIVEPIPDEYQSAVSFEIYDGPSNLVTVTENDNLTVTILTQNINRPSQLVTAGSTSTVMGNMQECMDFTLVLTGGLQMEKLFLSQAHLPTKVAPAAAKYPWVALNGQLPTINWYTPEPRRTTGANIELFNGTHRARTAYGKLLHSKYEVPYTWVTKARVQLTGPCGRSAFTEVDLTTPNTPPAPERFFMKSKGTGKVLQWEPVQFDEQFSYNLQLYQGSQPVNYIIIPRRQTSFPVDDTAITRATLRTWSEGKLSTLIELDMTQSGTTLTTEPTDAMQPTEMTKLTETSDTTESVNPGRISSTEREEQQLQDLD